MTKSMFRYSTNIGEIGMAGDRDSITNLWFLDERAPVDAVERETSLISDAYGQLSEYLSGRRKAFSLPLDPAGTPFQKMVWECLREIPYGRTRSYGDVAKDIGSPRASRAVGMANGRNPISIFIPCHRVIGADGCLAGYSGGLDIKEKLLDLEKSSFKGNPLSKMNTGRNSKAIRTREIQ